MGLFVFDPIGRAPEPATGRADRAARASRYVGLVAGTGLFVAALLLLAPGADGFALLLQGDEAMHISIARESLERKAWLAPQLYGAPNPFKPPLLYWFGMLSEAALGASLFAARAPSILAGALTVVALFGLLRRAGASPGRSAFYAALYLFTLGAFKFSRLALMEQWLTLALTACALFFADYLRTRSRASLSLAGLCAGLSFLLKGPLSIIYADLLLFAWSAGALLRFDLSPWRWKARADWPEHLRAWLWFHAAALIAPLAWMTAITLATPDGANLLRFFFVVENAGKFGSENQNELIIPGGFIFYAAPWSLFIAGLALTALVRPLTGRRRALARWLATGALLMLLMHLLPNRKGAYYTAPMLPLLFAAAALMDRRGRLAPFAGRLLRLTLAALAALALVFAVLWTRLAAEPFGAVSLLALALLLTGAAVWFPRLAVRPAAQRLVGLAGGALTLLAFQFLLLPEMNRPLIPPDVNAALHGPLCVLATNPHDAQKIALLRPHDSTLYYSTLTAGDCTPEASHLLVLRAAPMAAAPRRPDATWRLWKERLTPEDLRAALESPARLYDGAALYRAEILSREDASP